MTTREIITKDELSAWLTEQVANQQGCEGTTVTAQYTLRELDLDGCNWSETIVFNPGPYADKNKVTDAVGNALREARKRFNIE